MAAAVWADWLMLTLLSRKLNTPEMMGIRISPTAASVMPVERLLTALQGVWIRSIPRKW